MELDNLILTVICNDDRYLSDVISWYNKNYHTDFQIVKIIHDEVSFAEVRVTKYQPSDIFNLGYQFGVKEQKLRQEGRIDW